MPQKYLRTVTKAGGSLVVALPHGWVTFHKLKAGDKIEVITNGEVKIRLLKGDKNVA